MLAGRDAELAEGESVLDTLAAGSTPPRGLLFYGPRRNGKTALLLRLGERARAHGLRVEALPGAAFVSEPRLVRELQRRAGETGRRIRDVQLAGVGVGTEPAAPVEDIPELLARWVGRESSAPLVIVLDEAHALGPEAGRAWFDAVQDGKGRGLRFVLLAAGTPDAPQHLRKMGTHNERGFHLIPVGRLRRRDTATALAEPAETSGLPMTPAARRLLAAGSVDYPYFIQLLGRAAWDEAFRREEAKITLRAARAGAAVAQHEIEVFYGNRYAEAIGRRVEEALYPLAEALKAGRGRLPHPELRSLLRRIVADSDFAGDWVSLLTILRDLGVIWEVQPGAWEMGIPSFADHLIRRQKAESEPE